MTFRRLSAIRRTYFNLGSIPFWGVHLAAIAGVVLLGFSWTGLIWAAALYVTRMFFVTAGYHRYFSHRSFKTSRPVQLALAVGAQTSLQRGVLWWAANHRHHHRFSDQPEDIHSARNDGFWWSHVGWMLSPNNDGVDEDSVRDLTRYPEIRLVDRLKHLPGIALAALLFWIGGPTALVWGFFVSTVLLWHGTFTINSLSHLIGRRRYQTSDDSRNNPVLALITLGEGWHNNHHYYQRSAAQGFFWWEIDLTYYGLQAMQKLGLVRGLSRPPEHVVRGEPRPAVAPPPLLGSPAVDG
jgi:stearoyl-CoA desaturase (delta-9 desaturase)